ncbi:hypothetical protein EMIT0P44_230052 [Pseudomonas sp. IT-P44]
MRDGSAMVCAAGRKGRPSALGAPTGPIASKPAPTGSRRLYRILAGDDGRKITAKPDSRALQTCHRLVSVASTLAS